MKDFKFYAPTKVAFGKNTEEKVGQLVKEFGGTKVLLHYGGNSTIGCLKVLGCKDMAEIYKMAK